MCIFFDSCKTESLFVVHKLRGANTPIRFTVSGIDSLRLTQFPPSCQSLSLCYYSRMSFTQWGTNCKHSQQKDWIQAGVDSLYRQLRRQHVHVSVSAHTVYKTVCCMTPFNFLNRQWQKDKRRLKKNKRNRSFEISQDLSLSFDTNTVCKFLLL